MSALSQDQQAIAKLALGMAFYQHTIAAYFGCNQGRISEFKCSKTFFEVDAAPELPMDFPKHNLAKGYGMGAVIGQLMAAFPLVSPPLSSAFRLAFGRR